MRHKWTVMLVVLVTTIVTAQEAIKQYDDLKEQAGAWATSTLWASFLNTSSSAPEEELLEVQTATSCSVKEMPDDHSHRPETLTLSWVSDIKSINGQQRAETNQNIRIEYSTLKDKQHSDSHETAEETIEQMTEVALLAQHTGAKDVEQSEPEGEATEPDAARDNDTDDDPIVHAEREASFTSRTLNRVLVEVSTLGVDADAPVPQARAAFEARVQARAIKRAAKALQDSIDRGRRIELKRIRRGATVDPQNAASMSLRAENSSAPLATDGADALSAQINTQADAHLNTGNTCASEE